MKYGTMESCCPAYTLVYLMIVAELLRKLRRREHQQVTGLRSIRGNKINIECGPDMVMDIATECGRRVLVTYSGLVQGPAEAANEEVQWADVVRSMVEASARDPLPVRESPESL